jgi:hypothetical protein
MNVRVRPTIKCTLDAEESVLRIIAMEAIEDSKSDKKTSKHEAVIYALKVRLSSFFY